MASNDPTPPPSPDEPATPADDDDRGYEVPSQTWLVHGAIVVAFALFITVVLLLFVRWWSGTTVPNASIEFIGDERAAGISVRVDGTNLDAAQFQKLAPENRYRARFTVPAGLYLVQITRDGVPLVAETAVSVRESESLAYDMLRIIKPATQPAGDAAAPTTQPH